ncbi:MAG: hypothetical protein ACXVAG_02220 [Vulcanimicrobiaceae bacterium]
MLRTRFYIIGLVALAAGLAACGGGGGSSGGGGPIPNPSTPTPPPQDYPIAAGDAFNYAGSLTRSLSYAQPAPNPLPSTTTTAQVTQSVTVSAGTAPGGQSAADFHEVEQDAYPTQTTSLTTDAFYNLVTAGSGANVVEYGYKSSDSLSNSIQYAYTTPQVIAETPFASGKTWNNSPAVTITENDADGTTSTRTYAADGSYTDNEDFLSGQIGATATIVENANLSGSYSSNSFNALEDQIQVSAPASGQITISGIFPAPATPSPNPSGSPQPTPNPTTPPRVVTIPAWYSSSAKLYTETDSDGGSAMFDSHCSVPSSVGTQGEKLTQTIARLDTVLGYQETQTTTSYVVPNFGPACIVMSDTIDAYYDYQGDTEFGQLGVTIGPFAFYGSPFQTTVIAQTLNLQGATIKSDARHSAAVKAAPISITAFEAGRASFLNAIARDRMHRIKSMQKAMRSYIQRTGVR